MGLPPTTVPTQSVAAPAAAQLSASDKIKIGIGYAFAVATLIGLIYSVSNVGTDAGLSLRILLMSAGALSGWTTGILVTPQGPYEKATFQGYLKLLASFASGFVLAKLDVLAEEQRKVPNGLNAEAVLAGTLIFVVSFLLGALTTFVGRKYITG